MTEEAGEPAWIMESRVGFLEEAFIRRVTLRQVRIC